MHRPPARVTAEEQRLLPARWTAPAWLLLIASAAALLVLSLSVRGRFDAVGADAAVSRRLQERLSSRTYTLEIVALTGSAFALGAVVVVTAVACAWLRWARAVVLVLVAPALSVASAELVLKPLVHRVRDNALSFPSGTTTGVCSVTAVIGLLLLPRAGAPRWPADAGGLLARAGPALAVTVAGAVALAVAVAVVGLGWHYVSDVLGGVATAVTVVTGSALLIDAVAARRAGAATIRGQG